MATEIAISEAVASLTGRTPVLLPSEDGWVAIAHARAHAALLALPGVDEHELGPIAGDGEVLGSLLPPLPLRAQRMLERLLPGPLALRVGDNGPRIRHPLHPLWNDLRGHREPVLLIAGTGPLPSDLPIIIAEPLAAEARCTLTGGAPLVIERAGSLNDSDLLTAANLHLLCVCTGNTCRSPMLEGLLRAALTTRGLTDIRVASAGTHAGGGEPASDHTVTCLRERGIDLGRHLSQHIDDLELSLYDRFLCMTASHAGVLAQYGIPADRIHLVDPAGIPDPFGGPLTGYETCARAMDTAIDRIISDL
jgi:protein-tyrosine-phosphatase